MFLQIALALDQLINTLLGGMADETLSARAHRQHRKGRSFLRNVINGLFFWQADHCGEAYASEFIRAHLPKAYSAQLPADTQY